MKVLKVEKLNIDGILENINFEIEKGEIVTLVGSSGSGKTSIAKVIMGLSKLKYSGDIFVNSKKDYIRGKDICMIFQDIEQSLNPVLKIKKQFFEALIYHKICDKKNVMEYSKKILYKVNLNEKVLDRYPFELSGGEKQRIVIAMIISLNPSIIICDEISSSLDTVNEYEIFKILKSTNISLLVITHSPNVIKYISDRIIYLENGRKLYDGNYLGFIEKNNKYVKSIKSVLEVYDDIF